MRRSLCHGRVAASNPVVPLSNVRNSFSHASLADDLGGEGAEKLNGLFRASNARVSELLETEPRVRIFPPAAADTGVGLFG